MMLELKNITKSYRTKDYVQYALDKVSISFRKNEFASILGASGSGKTTMLNIIGGLDQYDSGDLLIEGVSTRKYKSSDWDTYRNNRVGFVFQSFNLISHQTVLSNVELALRLSGISAQERKERAIKALDDVGLIDHIHKLPSQISGGQMQRVAIARALINDPEIVLADEPTGALDSNTSDQVMDLLERIAKDRLVVMVTHNPELAHKYSNRIIELKDGGIIGDSNPYKIDGEEELIPKKSFKNSKMSFLTAVSLSISNLLTKKGRTFITAIAGSVGIIGIATILALASGINLYIDDIEQDTMSAYPLTIDSSGIDITSFLGGEGNVSIPKRRKKEEAKENEISVINTVTSIFSQQNKNDLKSFKEYIEGNKNKIEPYTNNIQYKYGVVPQIYLKDGKADVRQVNPDTIFSEYGFGNPPGFDMISGAGNFGMKNFSELPGENLLFEEQYDVVSGRWPKSMTELVVVLMDSGSLTDTTMYSLGIKDRSVLKDKFDDFTNEESVDIDDNKRDKTIYKEVLDSSFKLVNSAEKYFYDESYEIWLDKSEDNDYMDKVIEEGLDLEVVGIVKAKAEVKTPMLSTGIYYPSELTSHLIKEASSYDIVKKQLESKDINVFTNKPFGDETELNPDEIFKLDDFITIDQSMIQQAFNFDMSALNIDFSDFEINLDKIVLPNLDLEGLAETIARQINSPIGDIQDSLASVLNDYVRNREEEGAPGLEDLVTNFDEYITSEEVQNLLIDEFNKIDIDLKVPEKLSDIIPIEDIQNIFLYLLDDFVRSQEEDGVIEIEQWIYNFDEYIRSQEVQNQLIKDFDSINIEFQSPQKLNEIIKLDDIQNIMVVILGDFIKTQGEQGIIELEEEINNFDDYIRSEEVQNQLIKDFENTNGNEQISTELSEIVQNYFSSYMATAFEQVMQNVQSDFSRQIESKLGTLPANIQDSITIDRDSLTQAFQFNIDEDELFDLISSLGQRDQVNQNSNLKTLGYRDLDDPTEINLYPKDFTTKESVVQFIDDYNEKMLNTGQEDKVVNYTDLIAAILSSVTTIINLISYALIAFVGISLIVSSIMIGVITYVSVLERIKEIGILRAIGASKKDIRRVFNAETLIIGFIAGTFGILATYVISYFANIIIYNKFGISNLAHLEVKSALILILISMLLAFISGLIPSSTAAKKDPVEALRSE